MNYRTSIAALIFATSTVVTPAIAEEIERTELGLLECTVEGGFGLLLGSSKKMACSFEHKDGTVRELHRKDRKAWP